MNLKVNYIRHLNTFYRHVRKDTRLKSNHISLYVALFQIWNMHDFRNPFPIVRQEAMLLSRIGSRDTYTTCLKQLHTFGYIVYEKAAKQYGNSIIQIIILEQRARSQYNQLSLFQEENTRPEIVTPSPRPENRTPMCPGNRTHVCPDNRTHRVPKSGHFIKQNKNNIKTVGNVPPPEITEAEIFFQNAGHPEKEARKFFHHYEAIGWTINRQPIVDWQSAASKWIENIRKTAETKPNRLHVNTKKDYNKPF